MISSALIATPPAETTREATDIHAIFVELLQRNSCLNYQGYYFSKPLLNTDFEQLL